MILGELVIKLAYCTVWPSKKLGIWYIERESGFGCGVGSLGYNY